MQVIDVLHQLPVIQVKTVLGEVTAGQQCEIKLTFHRLTKARHRPFALHCRLIDSY
jgi:hypothetical protein